MNHTAKLILLLSIALAFSFAKEGSAAESVSEYIIIARIDVNEKRITAKEKIIFTNTSTASIEEIFLFIYPNRIYTAKEKEFMFRYAGFFRITPYPEGFPEPDFKIHDVTLDGTPAAFSVEGQDGTLLKIVLPNSLRPSEQITLDIDFESKIPHAYGRFGWHKNIMQLSRWYPMLTVLTENGWNKNPFYPFHRPFFSEASKYSVELTVPEDQVVIHSGILEKEERANGEKILSIKSRQPIREFSMAMSADYKLREERFEDVTIKSYYLPGDEFYAQKAAQSARDVMEFYTKRFGPYTYKEFSIAPVYLGYGGEQMSNLAFIDTRVYKLPKVLVRYFDFLISHETGHQWLYNMIGMNEFSEMWLEEGIHSYFIEQYLDGKYGPKASVLVWPHWAKKWSWIFPELTFDRTRDVRYKMLTRIGLDHSVIGDLSSFQEPSSIFSITYGKGARITGMLREILGDEAFDRVFKRIYSEYRFKNINIDDFIRICNEEKGEDLRGLFFDPWVFGEGQFDMAIKEVEESNVIIENRGDITMPINLKIIYSDGSEENKIISVENEETVTLSKRLQKLQLDPGNKLLDVDRTNNSWPRHIYLKWVPMYWPLYDHPIFLPEDSYNLVIGPEAANSGIGIKASIQKPYDQNFYVASDYEFSEQILHSRLGYQINNLFNKQMAFGVEFGNRSDYKDGDDDLATAKIFLRKELWPVQYGFGGINDHVTLYTIRNQGLKKTLLFSGAEYDNNVSYQKRNEAIVGLNFHMERLNNYLDPSHGYKIDWFYENAGHFWEATQAFNRTALDLKGYMPLTLRTSIAMRLKSAYGWPDDKNLFELGGVDGLRGYDRKEVRGSKAILGSIEYRFPIKDNLDIHLLDNIISFSSISGVVLFDAGEAWYDNYDSSDWKKDAGIGLRATMDIGSFLEKLILRLDIAQPINEPKEEPRFWFGINHAF